ncbi:serine/threonine-protein kinase [Yinghuangia soli]|uniref:non-specific serine/threonine protein kinase n=1 Tax=Yinghuangia soli TaxID=2908204 RepID=A0AA41U4V4_9ACTN|nr:serine/threonine-protein kinase [Yinghuangia soli]MCF2533340.1 serine/threonine protein kinase [Yinghuangia soli]
MTALPRRIPSPVPRSGAVLGDRYRLIELLGAGGTADVFRGLDMRLHRNVAVKVFRPGASAVTAERFCQEAELLGRLAHPALVEVHDVGGEAGHVYVVMRLVEGATLQEHILDGPLPAERVARLGVRLASALEHVHAAGVVHRDVKPSNVLVGLDDSPYLADFGISRLVDEPTRTAPGTLVGTIPYLAPEQLLGRGSGPASDIHALGLVLLEAVKGEKEYPGGPLAAGKGRALRAPHIPAWVPAELASAIDAMTRSEPADRPDAGDCVRLLESAAAGTASASPRKGAAHSAARSVESTNVASTAVAMRRRRHHVAALALVAGLVLGAGGATVPFLLAVGGHETEGTPVPPAPVPVLPGRTAATDSPSTPSGTPPTTPIPQLPAQTPQVTTSPPTTAAERGTPGRDDKGKSTDRPGDKGKGNKPDKD